MSLLTPTPPRHATLWPVSPRTKPAAPWHNPAPTILLIDDDAAVRESLGRVLAGQPFHVICAGSGTEALRLIEQHEPDLMITDLCMASGDGWDLLVRENRLRPMLPIFIITALSARETCGADQFATEFFQKPLDIDALIAAIRRHLHVLSSHQQPSVSP